MLWYIVLLLFFSLLCFNRSRVGCRQSPKLGRGSPLEVATSQLVSFDQLLSTIPEGEKHNQPNKYKYMAHHPMSACRRLPSILHPHRGIHSFGSNSNLGHSVQPTVKRRHQNQTIQPALRIATSKSKPYSKQITPAAVHRVRGAYRRHPSKIDASGKSCSQTNDSHLS